MLEGIGRTRAVACQRGSVLWGVAGAQVCGHWAPALNNIDDDSNSDRAQKPERRRLLATIILQGDFIALC